MRVARLLSLVFEVDSRPGVTAVELADELGVSVRTIYRDVAALQAAGIPLYGEVGRAGGLRLVEGYRSRSAALRSDEAAALLAGVVPGVAEQLGLGADAERAARKVRSQSERGRDRPRSSSAPAIGVGEILVDPVGWYRSPDEVPHLTTVAEAIRTHSILSIVYRRWAEPFEVRRRVAPLGLVLKAGTWYVMARSRGQVRTYRVNQIVRARLLPTTFEPDPAFDLVAAWAAFVSSFRDRLRVVDAHVVMTRATRDWIRTEGDPVMIEALDRALTDDLRGGPDDSAERAVVLPYESIERATAELLRFGRGVEVLGPPELRASVAAAAADVAQRYATADGARH
ncbi:MAG: WYL domain-containing protein [Ilumatobacteraceae bacterium]